MPFTYQSADTHGRCALCRITPAVFAVASSTIVTLFVLLTAQAFLVNVTSPWWGNIAKLIPSLSPMLEPHLKLDLGEVSTVRVALWLGLILAISVSYIVILLRAREPRAVHRIAWCFIGFSLLCRLGWVVHFDSYQYGDFGTYWDHGKIIASEGPTEPTLRPTYARRAIFYTAPIHLLFGDSQAALELVNVFLITLSTVLFYVLGRKILNPKAAAGSLLFFLWNPDIWYGVTLADHDIAFLPLFSALCLVIYWLDGKLMKQDFVPTSGVLLAMAAGVLIFLLDVQRSYGHPAFFALALLCLFRVLTPSRRIPQDSCAGMSHPSPTRLCRLRTRISHLVLLLVLPSVAYAASGKLFIEATGIKGSSDSTLRYLTAKDIHGSSSFSDLSPWRGQYSSALPKDGKSAFSVRKLLHEIVSDPVETVKYIGRKNIALAKPTSTLMASVWGARDPNVPKGIDFRRGNSSEIATQRAIVHLLSAIVYALLGLRLLFYRSFPTKSGTLFLIFYTGFFYLFILFFTEAAGRYDVFTVFLVSLLAAQVIFEAKGARNSEAGRARESGLRGSAALRVPLKHAIHAHSVGMAGLLLCVGLFFVFASCVAGSKLTLVDMRGFAPVKEGTPVLAGLDAAKPCPDVLIPGSISYNFKKLSFKVALRELAEPNCSVCFEKPVTRHIAETGGHIRFFVSAKPSGREVADLSSLTVVALVSDQLVWSIPVSEVESPLFVERPVSWAADDGPMTISFCLRSDAVVEASETVVPEQGLTLSFEYLDIR